MKLKAEWIVKAVEAIESGLAQKLEKDGVTVYQCGKVIRIDIKKTAPKKDTHKSCPNCKHAELKGACIDIVGPCDDFDKWEAKE